MRHNAMPFAGLMNVISVASRAAILKQLSVAAVMVFGLAQPAIYAEDDVQVTLLPGGKQIVVSAPAGGAPSPELRALLAQRMSFNFRDAELADIIEFFRKTTSVNFVLDPRLETQPITFIANDMELGMALEWTAKLTKSKISYVNQAVFFSNRAVRGPKKMVIYDIADLTMPIRDFPGPSLSLTDTGAQINQIFEPEPEPAMAGEELVEAIEEALKE